MHSIRLAILATTLSAGLLAIGCGDSSSSPATPTPNPSPTPAGSATSVSIPQNASGLTRRRSIPIRSPSRSARLCVGPTPILWRTRRRQQRRMGFRNSAGGSALRLHVPDGRNVSVSLRDSPRHGRHDCRALTGCVLGQLRGVDDLRRRRPALHTTLRPSICAAACRRLLLVGAREGKERATPRPLR